jgi:hypothetical protein
LVLDRTLTHTFVVGPFITKTTTLNLTSVVVVVEPCSIGENYTPNLSQNHINLLIHTFAVGTLTLTYKAPHLNLTSVMLL